MYSESFEAASNAAAKKVNLLKNDPFVYVLLSLLAGCTSALGSSWPSPSAAKWGPAQLPIWLRA